MPSSTSLKINNRRTSKEPIIIIIFHNEQHLDRPQQHEEQACWRLFLSCPRQLEKTVGRWKSNPSSHKVRFRLLPAMYFPAWLFIMHLWTRETLSEARVLLTLRLVRFLASAGVISDRHHTTSPIKHDGSSKILQNSWSCFVPHREMYVKCYLYMFLTEKFVSGITRTCWPQTCLSAVLSFYKAIPLKKFTSVD